MTARTDQLAILVGGGPAPGINSVIGAATIRACLSGASVLGIQDGFSHLMKGDVSRVRCLNIDDVSRIHFRGGSFLGISRADPTKTPDGLKRTVSSLLALGVDKLVTIGGDGTCYCAHRVEQEAKGKIRVVHVPKTIDNDIDLPDNAETFGYQTARHVGVHLVENLMVDARTTHRWYLVVTMGRKAGHLALGIGKAVGATITLIPEEFQPLGSISGKSLRLKTVVDTVVAAMLKRLMNGRPDGVAILAEGLADLIVEDDWAGLSGVERDEAGNLHLAAVPFADIVRDGVLRRLAELGVKLSVVSKNIGYELRCADPIPFDMEYSRDLGYCAAKFIIEGGTGAVVSLNHSTFFPIPFSHLVESNGKRTRVRMVDVRSDRYMIARRYMLRLRSEELADNALLARMAAKTNLTPEEFRRQFGYLVEDEVSPRSFVQSATPASRMPPPRRE